MRELWQREPDGSLSWFLHAGQMAALHCLARIILVLAGTQGGKTSFGPVWLLAEMQKCGPGDYIAASVSYPLFRLKMLPELRRLFCDEYKWNYSKSDRVITSPDGAYRIILLSAATDGGLESATAKAAWLDEWGQDTVGIEHFEAVKRRVALNSGRILITTTPYNLGWLKVNVYDQWKGGNPRYAVVNFRSIDNPAFPIAEYEAARAEMPDWRFRMFYNGEFTKPAGLIYSDYEDSYATHQPVVMYTNEMPGPGRYVSGGNLVRPFRIPDHWLRYVGADFGDVNTAMLWIAEDPVTHHLYAYREMHGVTQTYAEHARDSLAYGEPVAVWRGGAASEDEIRGTWQEAGVAMALPLIQDVEPGIDRGIGLFKTRRLFVFDTLVMFRSQLGTYSRELDDAGEPTRKISSKAKYHVLDAYRYIAGEFELDQPRQEQEQLPPADTRKKGSVAARLGAMAPPESEDY